MARSFGYDVLGCPRRGGRLRLVALIDEAAVIQRILGHLGLPTEVPQPRPARAPPIPWGAGVAHLDDQWAAWADPPGPAGAATSIGLPR